MNGDKEPIATENNVDDDDASDVVHDGDDDEDYEPTPVKSKRSNKAKPIETKQPAICSTRSRRTATSS
jgi:hypothetical protein